MTFHLRRTCLALFRHFWHLLFQNKALGLLAFVVDFFLIWVFLKHRLFLLSRP